MHINLDVGVFHLNFRHNFITLQVEMKGLATKIVAVLLLVWYSMSIIGFDVHTCSGSGRSFVVTFIEGLSCEDIHPEHKCDRDACCADSQGCCKSHNCCHHHSNADMSFRAKSCCSNDYQVLSLTGTSLDSKDDERDLCGCGHCLSVLCESLELPDNLLASGRIFSYRMPDPGVGITSDGQSFFGVWRI